MKIVTIKIGSNVLLTQRNKLDEFRVAHIADQIVSLREQGVGVVLVISGAVACGANFIHFSSGDRALKCAAAGVGQAYLISVFQHIFSRKQLQIAQVLLTKNFYASSKKELKKLFESYLRMGVIPVINENDVVDLNSFGGNDFLAANMAKLLKVDQLLILSTMARSKFGVGRGKSKLRAIEILKASQIQAAIVDGKSQNIILRSINHEKHD